MMLTALTAALESAFNTWLQLDRKSQGDALERLQTMQGKLICLHISNPELHLHFLPTTAGIRVATDYDAEPDVTIHGSALALMRLSAAEDTGKAMLEQGIRIEGDMGLGNRFSDILREIDVDWEELLSQAVGNIVAHQMGQLARDAKSWLDDSAHAMRLNTQEYLQEEARLLPAEAELRRYLDDVDTLRMDVDRLDVRIKRLQS